MITIMCYLVIAFTIYDINLLSYAGELTASHRFGIAVSLAFCVVLDYVLIKLCSRRKT